MGLKRLLKHLVTGETFDEVLYKWYTQENLPENLYRRYDLGEGMELVEQCIWGWLKPRIILNHNSKTAFEFMDKEQILMTVEDEDIDWNSLEGLSEEILERAKDRLAMFPTHVERFENGVSFVSWQINPDGRYYADEDGFGMTNDAEVNLHGYINKEGKVVGKFRLWKYGDDERNYRKLAEEAERANKKKWYE